MSLQGKRSGFISGGLHGGTPHAHGDVYFSGGLGGYGITPNGHIRQVEHSEIVQHARGHTGI